MPTFLREPVALTIADHPLLVEASAGRFVWVAPVPLNPMSRERQKRLFPSNGPQHPLSGNAFSNAQDWLFHAAVSIEGKRLQCRGTAGGLGCRILLALALFPLAAYGNFFRG